MSDAEIKHAVAVAEHIASGNFPAEAVRFARAVVAMAKVYPVAKAAILLDELKWDEKRCGSHARSSLSFRVEQQAIDLERAVVKARLT